MKVGCAFMICLISTAEATGAVRSKALTVGGRTRRYLVYEPQTGRRGQDQWPLVIALHGHRGSIWQMARVSGLNAAAERAGFLVAYPQGTSWAGVGGGSWNAWNCCGYARARQVDDVAFLRAMIDALQAEYPIDARRIYATGVSNGAMLAYRLACELSERLAAIAPVAGAMEPAACRPSQPVSVVIFHGTDDRYVPYQGGNRRIAADDRWDASVDEALGFWTRRNACAQPPLRQRQGAVEHVRYASCAAGAEVALYTIHGGGHAWPGGRRGWLFGARPTRELSATDTMWEFFAQHPKR